MRSFRNILAALMLSAGLIGGVTLTTDAALSPIDTAVLAQSSVQSTAGATPGATNAQCEDDSEAGEQDSDEDSANSQDENGDDDAEEGDANESEDQGNSDEASATSQDENGDDDADEGDANESEEQDNSDEDSANSQDENGDDDAAENDAEDNGSENESENAQPGELTEGNDLLSQATLTVDEAITTAQEAQSGDLGTIELEERDGTLVFEVTVGAHEVFVDAADGSVVSVDPVQSSGNDCEDESGGTATPVTYGQMSIARAMNIES
jgi:uncharacterized membrane protein YkoI